MDKKIAIILGVVIYLLTAFASYSYFNASAVDQSAYKAPTVDKNGNVVDTGPKTEPCPLNGQLYSKAQKAKWDKRRPLGIMVQNNIEARPQSGLSSADIIHEAVAEGGITRFLAIYYCEDSEIVGSVRSARIYFIKLLQAYGNNPLYAHVGGANTDGPADALGEIRDLDWFGYNDMDNLYGVDFPAMFRDYDRLPNRATEHTVYTRTKELWSMAEKERKLTNVDQDGVAWNETFEPYEFADEAKEADRGTVGKINYGFWDDSLGSDYTVQWDYDKTTNMYARMNGGEPHIDKNTEKQLTTKNVIVLLADESVANDGYDHGEHMLYDIIGTGDAFIFQNGKSIEGTWKKPSEEDMMRFYDEDNKEVAMASGKIWISILPTGNDVDFSTTAPKKTN